MIRHMPCRRCTSGTVQHMCAVIDDACVILVMIQLFFVQHYTSGLHECIGRSDATCCSLHAGLGMWHSAHSHFHLQPASTATNVHLCYLGAFFCAIPLTFLPNCSHLSPFPSLSQPIIRALCCPAVSGAASASSTARTPLAAVTLAPPPPPPWHQQVVQMRRLRRQWATATRAPTLQVVALAVLLACWVALLVEVWVVCRVWGWLLALPSSARLALSTCSAVTFEELSVVRGCEGVRRRWCYRLGVEHCVHGLHCRVICVGL